MTESQTVLVTGGAGFIGSEFAIQLVERGHRVRVLDNLRRAKLDIIEPLVAAGHVELLEGDIRYRATVERAMPDVDTVVHLASTAINKSLVDPAESVEINMSGSENVFSVAAERGVRRVVFASTASVYGEPDELPMHEDGPLKPQTPYCICKLGAEQLLQFYGRQRDLDWTIFRFFNVYGPGQRNDAYYTSVINVFIERLLDGEVPLIDGSGEQTMDFIHVRDIARGLVLAVEAPRSKAVMNLGTGVQTSVAQLARMLIAEVGVDVEPQFSPRAVLVTKRAADWSRAEAILGWKPTIGVADGLAEVVKAAQAARRER